MPKIMKSSTVKKVIVKLNKTVHEIAVDSSLFDDVYVEAATRVVETHRKSKVFFQKMDVIAECYEKKDAKIPQKHFAINMYHILLNAGLYPLAELLREKIKFQHSIDMQEEPIRATGADGSTTKN